jgi:heme A synthase
VSRATARALHPRAFKVTVGWTLILLFLGSVVHATESSLACPDWPTCFGTMVPEMTGGVFWEHLHRLVAGGLALMFLLATWLAHKEVVPGRRWIVSLSYVGIGLLVVQSVFGGLTVLYRLPDLVSTTHLGLAFAFLVLATVLATATSPSEGAPMDRPTRQHLRTGAWLTALLVFSQSVLGAMVRHMDAGMACPDVPLCLGRVVPPLVNAPITVHFLHRVLAVVVTAGVIALAAGARAIGASARARRSLDLAVALVVVQVGLGVASVMTVLAVPPVSLHTLVAAALVATLAHVATLADRAPEPVAERAASATA